MELKVSFFNDDTKQLTYTTDKNTVNEAIAEFKLALADGIFDQYTGHILVQVEDHNLIIWDD